MKTTTTLALLKVSAPRHLAARPQGGGTLRRSMAAAAARASSLALPAGANGAWIQARSLWNIDEPHEDIVAATETAKEEMRETQRRMRINYQCQTLFEPRRMKYYIDGDDTEFKDHCRLVLAPIFAPLQRSGPLSREELIRVVRAVGKKRLYTIAQARSTPRKFASFLEVLATFNAPAAIMLGNHVLACTMCAAYMRNDILVRELEGTEDFTSLGAVCMSSGVSHEENTPLRALVVPAKSTLLLLGTAAVPAVGAGLLNFAIVRAAIGTKFVRKDDQLFFVRLRDASGKPLPGIQIREPLAHEAVGFAMVEFDEVVLEQHHIISDTTIDTRSNIIFTENKDAWLNTLNLQHLIISCSVLAGTVKRVLRDSTVVASQKVIRGPEQKADYPFLGLQRNQSALSPLVCSCITFLNALNTLLNAACDTTKNPTVETIALLQCMQHELLELNMQSHRVQTDIMGPMSGCCGHHLPSPRLLGLLVNAQSSRALAFQAGRLVAQNKLGPHGGWHRFVRMIPPGMARRFISNPMFSTTSRQAVQHSTFYVHKHAMLMERMAAHLRVDRSLPTDPEKWYHWHALRYRDVENLAESYMEIFLIDAAMKEMAKSMTPETSTQINMVTLTCSAYRMFKNSAFYVKEYMVSPKALSTLTFHFDNMSSVLGPRLVPLTSHFYIDDSCTPFGLQWQPQLGFRAAPPAATETSETNGAQAKAADDYTPETDY